MATPTEERLSSELASRGLRATRQRIEALRVLRRRSSHPTAAELHRAISRQLPNISLKTVYGVLESFVSAGLAACVTEGGEPYRYEAGTEPHYHARCRICGRLDDLPANANGPIQGRSRLPEGFSVDQISVTLLGRCARCKGSI